MMYKSLYELAPEIAEKETVEMVIKESGPGLPPVGRYVFVESLCTETGCDCRNMMITVLHIETKQMVTRLRFCWEKPLFYKSIGLDFMEDELPGVFIDLGCHNFPYSKYFLDVFREMCYGKAPSKKETPYAQRLKQHYRQCHERIAEQDEAAVRLMIPQTYDPCPCNSGKKFKFCCQPIFYYITEAMCATQDGLHKKALEFMEKAAKLVGNTAEVLCRKAIVYSDFDRKLYAEYLQKCLEINPRHPRAYYLQGLDFKNKGDSAAAIEAYLKAIEYYPPTARYHLNEVYNNLGNVYYDIGEKDKAVAAWEKALEYSPKDMVAQANLREFGAVRR
ncbi:MAG: tetratricopeptide repeat protein [Chlamydiae bacterium]|nr:tetratricopeptide repeat protein [Chlamydiota bacterium]